MIERLAAPPGFYVPAFHHPEEDGDGLPKLNKLELTEEQMQQPGTCPPPRSSRRAPSSPRSS